MVQGHDSFDFDDDLALRAARFDVVMWNRMMYIILKDEQTDGPWVESAIFGDQVFERGLAQGV